MKDYILFELKLISRSLRLKRLMTPLIFLILSVYLMHIVSDRDFLVRIFFLYALISVPGATYSQIIFAMEASFIDKLLISPFSVYSILKAKYYLYCCFAFVMVVIMLPIMLLDIKLSEILSSFFYTVGFVYFICFQNARFSAKEFDIKAVKYFNWQGYSFITQHLIPLICLIVSMGIIVITHQIFGENIALIVMCITGISFVTGHKLWLMPIAKNFEKNLVKRCEQKDVLNIPQLSITNGELLGIIGNTGAGKTTFSRLCLDFLPADEGQIFINNHNIHLSGEWKKYVSAFFNERFLIDFLTPKEYFYFSGNLYGLSKKEIDANLTDFKTFLGEEILDSKHLIDKFSKSDKQKIGIVAAIICRPRLLLLDESFNCLDTISQAQIKKLLLDCHLKYDMTVILSSNNIQYITDFCNRFVVLDASRILYDGSNITDAINYIK
ncbi:MAG: DUF5687 family protein [Bacteroidales bacterium]|jgi:ABC-2 type transport system ATP-binding protein|nr:DUF5687 family protein [Bacteroidales bacterium]